MIIYKDLKYLKIRQNANLDIQVLQKDNKSQVPTRNNNKSNQGQYSLRKTVKAIKYKQ